MSTASTPPSAPGTVVLGGTGFLGYHAVFELLRRGHRVTVLALDLPAPELLPPEVTVRLADLDACSDDDLATLLAGQDNLVFAMGADDRVLPAAPAYDFFHRANVLSTQRVVGLARRAGLRRVVVCGSYFAYFDRTRPQLRLAEHHPYIRARREQARVAIEAGGQDLVVSVLELPYIFGSMPGRKPLWTPLVRYLASPWPLLYTRGGTAMVTVERVAEAIAGACEREGESACFPVGDRSVPWRSFVEALATIAGRPKRMVTVPSSLAVAGAWCFLQLTRLQGKEHGLHPVRFIAVQTSETFIDPADLAASRRALGFGTGGLEAAFERTVRDSLA
jgi:dihydroflavonol-4-reductase